MRLTTIKRRPTDNGVEIICIDDESGSSIGVDLPIDGYKELERQIINEFINFVANGGYHGIINDFALIEAFGYFTKTAPHFVEKLNQDK